MVELWRETIDALHVLLLLVQLSPGRQNMMIFSTVSAGRAEKFTCHYDSCDRGKFRCYRSIHHLGVKY
jgi:hypothetical protein